MYMAPEILSGAYDEKVPPGRLHVHGALPHRRSLATFVNVQVAKVRYDAVSCRQLQRSGVAGYAVAQW